MPVYLDVPLADGSSFTVEVDEPQRGPVTRGGGRLTDTVVEAGQSLEDALDRVSPAFRVLVGKLREAAERPDDMEIEFGLKLSTELGAIVAKTAGEANFRVCVRWSRGA
jgi:Trypsin-co-occurring domain 1